MQNEIKLYTYCTSSASWRVRIALNLKKIEYQQQPVNLRLKENKEEWYSKINPQNTVPALQVNGQLIVESMAIIGYLEEVFDTGYSLLPKDHIGKAKVRAFCEVINTGIHAYTNTRMKHLLQKYGEHTQQEELMKQAVLKGFQTLETLIDNQSENYCFGNEVSMADIFLVPTVSGALKRFKLDLEQYPKIKKVYDFVSQLPEFKAASPEMQADFIKE